jgi:hypothetical protein
MAGANNTSDNKIFGSEAQHFKDWINGAISNWTIVAS